MSRAKFGRLFNSTPDAAYYFLKQLEKRNLLTLEMHAKCTQVTICNIESYDYGARKQHANSTQEDEVTRNLHANYTQTNDCKSECYDGFARNLHANSTQYDESLTQVSDLDFKPFEHTL